MRKASDRRGGPPARPIEQAGPHGGVTLGARSLSVGNPVVGPPGVRGVALMRDLAERVRAGVAAGAHAVDAETHSDAVRLVELGVCASAVIAEDTCGLVAPPGRARVHWHADGLTVIARDLADLATTLPLVGTAGARRASTSQLTVGAHTDSLADPWVRDVVGDLAATLSLGGVRVTDLDAGRSALLGGLVQRWTGRRESADDGIDVVLTSVPPPEAPGRAGIVVTFPFGPERSGRAEQVQLRARPGVGADAVLGLLRAVEFRGGTTGRVA